MRAIKLQDQSFAQVAMMKWGSLDRQQVIVGTGRQKPRIVNEIVPLSKAHTEQVSEDFMFGLGYLVNAVGWYITVE